MKDVFAPNGGAFLRELVQHVSAQGHDLEAALEGRLAAPHALMSASPAIPTHEHAIVLEVSEALCGDPCLGFSLAKACDLRQAGLLGYALGACATLSEALQVLARLSGVFRLTTPEAAAGASGPEAGAAVPDQIEVRWDYGASGKLDLHHWSEFSAALLVKTFSALSDGYAMPEAVHFSHRASGGTEAAQRALGVVPTYEAAINRLVYAEADLALPFQRPDAGLLQVLLEYADLIQRVEDLEQNSLAIVVERLIMDGISKGDASLARVAELLGISQRTLSRKLASEGTSFFAILEGVRKSLALRYLRQNEKSLSEISHQLGYASLSSFNDAFRRWTGKSPGGYRNSTTRGE